MKALLALAIMLVVAAVASAEPIRVTEDENNNIDFSFDPEEEGNIIHKDEEVDALRHLAKRSPIPPFDPFTKTKKKFKKFKKFVVKPKKLKKLIKKLPKLKKAKKLTKKFKKKALPKVVKFGVPFGAGLGFGGLGGLGASQLPAVLGPIIAGIGGGGGAVAPFLPPPPLNLG